MAGPKQKPRGGGGRSASGAGPKRPRRPPRRGARPGWIAWLKLASMLVVLVALGFYAVRWVRSPIDRPDLSSPPPAETRRPSGSIADPGGVEEPSEATSAEPQSIPSDAAVPRPPTAVRDPGASPVGHLSIVIDDLGRSLADIERLEALGVAISYAVLPYESRTDEVVARLRARRREILCHLPMEAVAGNNPGPGALVLGMSPRQLAKATRSAVARIPGAVGVNNHMGSGLTRDRDSMQAILEVLRDEELFFLDSRTSAETVAFGIARSLEIPTAERQVFLDTDPSAEAIREQFVRLRKIGADRGAAIAIGHPYPTTLEVLEEEVPRSLELGFNFVPVSFLLERTGLR